MCTFGLIPGMVGKTLGVDTSDWNLGNSWAKWALRKISVIEQQAAGGQWDQLAANQYTPKPGMNKYSASYVKAILDAQAAALRMKDVAEAKAHGPMTDTYEDVRLLIYNVCNKFWLKNGGDMDEYVGESNIVYLRAYNTWKPDKGTKFSSYLQTCIWRHLISFHKRAQGRLERRIVPVNFSDETNKYEGLLATRDRPADIIGDFVSDLSSDAASIVRLVVEAPAELVSMVKSKGGAPCNWSSSIKSYLKGLGWTHGRIVDTFEELAGAVG